MNMKSLTETEGKVWHRSQIWLQFLCSQPHKQASASGIGWAAGPPRRPKWGRRWRKFEEKWKTLQEKQERLRKYSNFPMREWEASYMALPQAKVLITMVIIKLKLHVRFWGQSCGRIKLPPLTFGVQFPLPTYCYSCVLNPFVCALLWQVSEKEEPVIYGHEEVGAHPVPFWSLKALSAILNSKRHFFTKPLDFFLHIQRELHCNNHIPQFSWKQYIFWKERQFFFVRN